MLDVALLFNAISDAAALGYEWISFSGGEPLLYRHLPELLRHTKALGLHTALATNGMLLNARHLDPIAPFIDLVAISIDGVPDSHNHIRAHDHAFEHMASHLGNLRERGMNFGFIFTLTQHNLHELQWVADFALEQGAKLLQIHHWMKWDMQLKIWPAKPPIKLKMPTPGCSVNKFSAVPQNA